MSKHMKNRRALCAAAAAVAFMLASAAWAQVIDPGHSSAAGVSSRPWAANVVVPQVRVYVSAGAVAAPAPAASSAAIHRPYAPPRAIEITSVEVGVVILEQSAATTMDISLRNLTNSRQEAELLLPVPQGAVVRSFTFEGAAAEPTAELLPRLAAESTYHSIVAKVKDPALLEFAACNLIRSSVFPLGPSGTQKVRLTYEMLLAADGNRVDYELPRSESLDYSVPWTISVRVKSKRPISTVYSPTHQLQVKRESPQIISARVTAEAARQPGPLRLSYLMENDWLSGIPGVSASLFAYPDPKTGGGYFLLLAGVPATLGDGRGAPAIRREVTLVLDHSGSMGGRKIEQVRQAAKQVIGGLADGEAFNILVYNESVERFAPEPVLKTAETARKAEAFLAAVRSSGGTNLYDALTEALRTKPREAMLPIMLFLTDGLPTVGETREAAIRDVALKANPFKRRIFTFGVGVDVNAPLLEKIAAETRAMATFVLPNEDVEVKVSQVFKRLAGPVLTDPGVAVVDAKGDPALGRVTDLLPARLPDMFEDDQLVLIGRYTGDEPLTFHVSGNYLGRQRTVQFRFDLARATTRNAFVPRLWASRRIAMLLDSIRQMGAASGTGLAQAANTVPPGDPRLKELVDEVVRLSTEFGILTEYTAFLAREGTDLSRRDQVLAEATRNFQSRAIATRSGLGAVNQDMNMSSQRGQTQLNGRNEFYDQNMNRVSVSAVQQVNDRAFYRRGDTWVDSRIVGEAPVARPVRTIEFGSEEFRRLAERLNRENRGGTISLSGDILMEVDGQPVLIKGAAGPR